MNLKNPTLNCLILGSFLIIFAIIRIINITIWGQYILQQQYRTALDEAYTELKNVVDTQITEFSKNYKDVQLLNSCKTMAADFSGVNEIQPLGLLWVEIGLEIFLSVHGLVLMLLAGSRQNNNKTDGLSNYLIIYHWLAILACFITNIVMFIVNYPGTFLGPSTSFGISSLVIFSIKYLIIFILSIFLCPCCSQSKTRNTNIYDPPEKRINQTRKPSLTQQFLEDNDLDENQPNSANQLSDSVKKLIQERTLVVPEVRITNSVENPDLLQDQSLSEEQIENASRGGSTSRWKRPSSHSYRRKVADNYF